MTLREATPRCNMPLIDKKEETVSNCKQSVPEIYCDSTNLTSIENKQLLDFQQNLQIFLPAEEVPLVKLQL